MAERDSKAGQIQFKALGGLNERSAPYNQQGVDFFLLEGLFPAQDGLMERIPGKQYYVNVNGVGAGSVDPIQVWNIHPTSDGSGNIIVQTSVDLRLYTLDELLGRSTSSSLTFATATEEESATMALIVHREANGTNGGLLGDVENTFFPRKLTHKLTDDIGITFRAYNNGATTYTVVAGTDLFTAVGHGLVAGDKLTFVNSGGALPTGITLGKIYYVIASGLTADDFRVSATVGGSTIDVTGAGSGTNTYYKNGNQFELPVGSYRIKAYLGYAKPGGTIDTEPVSSIAKLYNVTSGADEVYDGSTQAIVSTAGREGAGTTTSWNNMVTMDAQFTVTTSTKTFSIYQTMDSEGSGQNAAAATNALGNRTSVTASSLPEYYAIIKILKLP